MGTKGAHWFLTFDIVPLPASKRWKDDGKGVLRGKISYDRRVATAVKKARYDGASPLSAKNKTLSGGTAAVRVHG
jgi:hypothetical protein